ncbi:hypothetical protein GS928_25115 [Rhodococcus hoagii]|nr:hypothetical protein [Prescottella equi]NKU15227.1 hypothetical protein [Prescottella equi]NKU15265.1 hypothetical protein [Prescottella equi]NKU16290.1 hypothetical protein [Prescottella equi]NKU16298.1 hypothetical protein [Prescottella equi]
MSQDLVRARRGISNGPDSRLQQAETALAAAVHENNELRAENARTGAAIEGVREYLERVIATSGADALDRFQGSPGGELVAAAFGTAAGLAERALEILGGDR